MKRFHDNCDSLRMEQVANGISDLASHAFLDLEAVSVKVHNARNFG